MLELAYAYAVPMTAEECSVLGALWLVGLAAVWLFGWLARLSAPEKRNE